MEYGVNGVLDSCITTCEHCNQGTGFDRGCWDARPTCPIVLMAKNVGYDHDTDSVEE